MKILLGWLALVCVSLNAYAGESVDETLKADKKGQVTIEHLNGSAKIYAWDKAEVKVKGSLSDHTKQFIFERDDDEIIIKVDVKNHKGWKNWGSDDGDRLEIYVPTLSHVNYDAVNASLKIEGVKGSSTIEVVNGDVDAKDLAGRVRIESVNGDVQTKGLEGNVKIETVNGDIRSRSSNGQKDSYDSVNGDIKVTSDSPVVSVETVNGDTELHLGQVDELNIDTVNGDVDVKLELLKGGEVDANSVGGDISLSFQNDVSATFDIEAHAGGRISNELSKHKMQKAQYGPRRWLEFSLNGGSAEVNVSTVSGRVDLKSK